MFVTGHACVLCRPCLWYRAVCYMKKTQQNKANEMKLPRCIKYRLTPWVHCQYTSSGSHFFCRLQLPSGVDAWFVNLLVLGVKDRVGVLGGAGALLNSFQVHCLRRAATEHPVQRLFFSLSVSLFFLIRVAHFSCRCHWPFQSLWWVV